MSFRQSLFRSLRNYCHRRNYSDKPDELIIFKNDMAICWHPEPKFPYECSKPLPKVITPPKSILKTSEEEAFKMFTRPEKPPEVMADELAKMTYTTKHIWFPRARDKKAKKTEPDRPYL
ncbi:39S ribosomal protein L42, mitochondrial [Microplitis demolitor]|uniref:39S ribosomal protein L42, mitochondrial n=1 Tax=Microplitis demolitor TaxID=69319 RepID=UPI0004CD4B70|nr:39S ribosomal protein L42, mitochondrial [Microplitis demolitor]